MRVIVFLYSVDLRDSDSGLSPRSFAIELDGDLDMTSTQ